MSFPVTTRSRLLTGELIKSPIDGDSQTVVQVAAVHLVSNKAKVI